MRHLFHTSQTFNPSVTILYYMRFPYHPLAVVFPQKKVLSPGAFQDNAVGHLIVLLQYDWPTEEPIFSKVRLRADSRFGFVEELTEEWNVPCYYFALAKRV